VEGLISHRLPLEGLERGIESLEGGLDGVKKVMIVPNLA
jgi:threonine dehydrogenase-like Zn-dependent dehydrogenase